MSSFKRKPLTSTSSSSPSALTIPPHSRSSPASPFNVLVSSGNPSFDDILGGGIQLGTTTALLTPDSQASYGRLLLKYFIAQGLAHSQPIYIMSQDGQELVDSCMWLTNDVQMSASSQQDEDIATQNTATSEEVKIAWRYHSMKKFQTTVPSFKSSLSDDYCSPFDLSSKIPSDMVQKVAIKGQLIIDGNGFQTHSENSKKLDRLRYFLESSKSLHPSAVARIVIPDLGGPWWGDMDPPSITRILFKIRQLLRTHQHACVMMTFPHYLCQEHWSSIPGWLDELSWSLDTCVALNSSIADPSKEAHLPNHHGLVRIYSLPRLNVLVPSSDRFSLIRGLSTPSTLTSIRSPNYTAVGENNIAFKCTRRRMIFETFHLDVEGGVGERRTNPAPSMSERIQVPETLRNDPAPSVTQIQQETRVEEDLRPNRQDIGPTAKKVKVKKKVGFQVGKPDLYDF